MEGDIGWRREGMLKAKIGKQTVKRLRLQRGQESRGDKGEQGKAGQNIRGCVPTIEMFSI